MSARINFKPKPEKTVESILYLALKGLELDQYKTVKLLYLADREHFRRFGRPITFDKYVAMKFGPVASLAYDLVRGKKRGALAPKNLPFDLTELGKFLYVENPKREIQHRIFSKSDLLVLDEIAEQFGNQSFKELYNLTHRHFAYKRAWDNRQSDADLMAFEDFLDEDASKEEKVSDLEFTARGM